MNSEFSRFRWLCLFVLATVASGLILRWQLAGFSWAWASELDWRRAHSHLGFYGVLFPLSWFSLRASAQWLPGSRLWTGYNAFVAGAGMAFLLQGYGFFSIVASTGILIVWLLFAFRNLGGSNSGSEKNQELLIISVHILISAALIFAVALLTKRDPDLAQRVARTFLSLLLFGVFIPSVLKSLGEFTPPRSVWIVTSLMSALYLTKLVPHFAMGTGAVVLSGLVAWTVLKNSVQDRRLKALWFVFSFSLACTGLGIFENTYLRAIAGIHFLVLGPIFMTFVLCHLKMKIHPWLRGLYEFSALSMVTAIFLQEHTSTSLQAATAIAGTVLVFVIVLILLDRTRSAQRAH